MKFLLIAAGFWASMYCTYTSAQNQHMYGQLSQTYLTSELPYKIQILVKHSLLCFEDSVVIDVYRYQEYYNSVIQNTNRKDSIIVEYTFQQEGWYQVLVFSPRGVKLYQTSVLILYKPKYLQVKSTYNETEPIQVTWKGEDILFKNDSLIMLHKKRRPYEIEFACKVPYLQTDTLLLYVYQYDKKNSLVFGHQWYACKQGEKYKVLWIVKKKELGKYRISFFDARMRWYGAVEVELQEAK
ncbi:MAG: hypothetical protein NZ455_03540 [Bacteroidia bacterium]|nr:hypothetical protein [Bacteroidia bacterium]MDW8346058.1 hypothetical protein [Bacteroidia bacterium]